MNVSHRWRITGYEHTTMNRIFHPLLALIASATDRELARYVEFLKTENQILRSRIKGQVPLQSPQCFVKNVFGLPSRWTSVHNRVQSFR